QEGDANDREKDRDSENQCTIHPRFLQQEQKRYVPKKLKLSAVRIVFAFLRDGLRTEKQPSIQLRRKPFALSDALWKLLSIARFEYDAQSRLTKLTLMTLMSRTKILK